MNLSPDANDALTLLRKLSFSGTLNAVGTRTIRGELERCLKERSRLPDGSTDSGRELPDRVIVIVGLPRSGTTLLHNLLALDPRSWAPSLWQSLYPSESPVQGLRATRQQLRLIDQLSPSLRRLHPLEPRWPEECTTLQQIGLISQRFSFLFDAPTYDEWYWGLAPSSQEEAIAAHLALLRQLSDMRSSSWTLKAPSYLADIHTLFALLEDRIQLVWCLRAPTESIVSFASLLQHIRRVSGCRMSPADAGRYSSAHWRKCVQRVVSQSPAFSAGVGVGYKVLVDAPERALDMIYEGMGIDRSPALAVQRRWLADNRHRKLDRQLVADEFLTPSRPNTFADYQEWIQTNVQQL